MGGGVNGETQTSEGRHEKTVREKLVPTKAGGERKRETGSTLFI